MELIYIWIEEFRNLKDIGFNFSNDIEFSYDSKAEELQAEPKDNPRNEFFGPKITNVTAIIGKNGTGKSNLLDLICYLTKSPATKFYKFILIYGDKELITNPKFYCKSNIPGLKLDARFRKVDPGKSITNLSLIFFSNVADGRQQRFSKDVIDVSQNSNFPNYTSKGSAYNQLKFLLSDYARQVDIPEPSKLLLTCRTDILIRRPLKAYLEQHEKVDNLIKHYRQGIRRLQPKEQLQYSFRYALLIYCLNQVFLQETEDLTIFTSSGADNHFNKIDSMIEKRFPDYNVSSHSIVHNQIEKFLEDLMYNFNSLGAIDRDAMHILLDFDKALARLDAQLYQEKMVRRVHFEIFFDQSNRNILREFLLVFEFHELLDLDWIGMSSGHKAFLNLFAQLHSTIRRTSQSGEILICIDEGDLYLHPEWQRQFLNRVITFIPTIFKKSVQLILTTHSPFLISDLPKENLILLGRNDLGDCEIITDQIKLRQTFGANIYDLFKGPFVLDKSTISQFAYNKINEVINLLQTANLTRTDLLKIKQIISAVGDEPIYFKLNEMLNDAEVRLHSTQDR